MRYSKYLMEEKIINVEGMWPIVGIVVALTGVVMIAGMMPVAYAIDKTDDLWQKVK